jgi:hypothetical protein
LKPTVTRCSCVAEINAIAKLQTMSQTKEFTQAAKQAAEAPLNVARDLVTNPVSTISSVPNGIWGFLNQTGEDMKEMLQQLERTGESHLWWRMDAHRMTALPDAVVGLPSTVVGL